MATVSTSYTGFYIDTSKILALCKFKGTIWRVRIEPIETIGGIQSDVAPAGTMFFGLNLTTDLPHYGIDPMDPAWYTLIQAHFNGSNYRANVTYPTPLEASSYMTWRKVSGTTVSETSTSGYARLNDQTYYKGDVNTLFDLDPFAPMLTSWGSTGSIIMKAPLSAVSMKRGYADAYALKADVEGGASIDVEWEMGVFDIDYAHPDHGTKNFSTGGTIGSTTPSPPPPSGGTPSGGTPASTSGTQQSAPTVSPVPAVSAPSPKTFNLSGGSILLLHSDTNPPTSPAPPTPNDFFTNGMPASGSSTLNHTFTSDMLSSVALTNNSINTIFYYAMDAAQNIQYLGHVTFYVDRDKPVGSLTPPSGASWIDTAFPTANTPYTAEWLGKNKMAPFDGNISLCDLPGTSPTSTWPYTIS